MFELAARAGYDQDTVYRVVKGLRKTVEFTMADKLIIAATGVPMPMLFGTHPDLEEAYYRVELVDDPQAPEPVVKTCARVGCSEDVIEPYPTGTRTPKEYCSAKCRQAARMRRQAERNGTAVERTAGPDRKLLKVWCRKGLHERTEGNTYTAPNGNVSCRDCAREAKRRRRGTR